MIDLTKQDNLKSPASKKLTIGLIVVGLIWMVIGAFLNLMLSVTGVFASFVMLFDLGFGGIVLWLIDEKEKSNKLVKRLGAFWCGCSGNSSIMLLNNEE